MKTAMMSVVPLRETVTGNTAAVESAVDAYATRVLENESPPETFVDTSLGPYVTALLRCAAIEAKDDVTGLSEFESLVELLEDQCSMRREDAERALKSIAHAVCTGIVPNEHGKASVRVGPYTSGGLDSFHCLGNALKELEASDGTYEAAQAGMEPYTPTSAGGPSPLKPDNLIPVDLLGALDDFSPKNTGNLPAYEEHHAVHDEAFPPLGAQVSAPSKKAARSKKAPKTHSKDLAAALFRPARPRQNSIENEDSPQVKSTVACVATERSSSQVGNQYFQQQLDSAVEILLSLNTGLSEEAAVEAALMANTDFNVAQYVVDAALSAPPVCRHMLHDGCYRSDCQFSHDVDGHTCVFWLRGRCGKGNSCKFLHGFNQNLLNSINSTSNVGPTHAPPQNFGVFVNPSSLQPAPLLPGGFSASLSSKGFERSHTTSSWNREVVSGSQNRPHASGDGASGLGIPISFANIASQGYDQSKFQFSSAVDTSNQEIGGSSEAAVIPTVRIPLDLWNPHENRDASVFHIADPLERYNKVSTWTHRPDVIDLHYQSTKTFIMVLSKILPEKLHEHEEVWIVTGTGHHVGTKTHQKGGGMLEMSVTAWLSEEGYNYCKGRDRNGLGGAVLVKR